MAWDWMAIPRLHKVVSTLQPPRYISYKYTNISKKVVPINIYFYPNIWTISVF